MGIEGCLVQPGRARAYAHAEGQSAKTDPLDAHVLRRFGQAVQLRLRPPSTGATEGAFHWHSTNPDYLRMPGWLEPVSLAPVADVRS